MEYTNVPINYKEKINESDIIEIEEKYHFKFPQEVKEYYLVYNGGTLKKNAYVKNRRTYWVHFFYPIKYERYNMDKMISLSDEDNTPIYLIPFATDEGGDEFCFSIKKGEEGKIYFLKHEFYDKENPEKGVVFLADSFNEWINHMVKKRG